jgi:hypothetical protein
MDSSESIDSALLRVRWPDPGIERAGFTAIVAANRIEFKVKVHEANHPHVEH